jgi:Xaa-Pro aminopeptidase
VSLDIAAVQRALGDERLDGWLLYDFHGSNPVAVEVTGLAGRHTTRRWYYFIPAAGQPTKLVHAIEAFVLDGLPGRQVAYAGRLELEDGLRAALRGARTVAMEYSPDCAIPYVSRVDGGTLELVRRLGPVVVSSADLVQQFAAVWDAEATATHRTASERLYRVKDQAFAYVAAKLGTGDSPGEFEVQQKMVKWMGEAGLVFDAPPIVAAQEHAGNPHYSPARDRSRPIRRNELLLLDLWGKLDHAGAVYADITWVGHSGEPPAVVVRAFDAVVAGRDAAVALVERRAAASEPVRGFEVDRAARDVIARAGFGGQFIHRTGHSLGRDVHGNGVHMDDYETHDTRRLLPGTGFTIEPGVYTPRFGVRSEINMVVGERSAEVTGPRQERIVQY